MMRLKKWHGLLVVVVSLAVFGCAAGTMQMGSNSEIPGAAGAAKLHRTKNGNTQITLSVKHLAPPDKVTTGTSVYVVWVQGLESGAQAQNMGALRVNDNLTGTMEAVTPLHGFELFLTAEAAQTVTYPSGNHLLPLHYSGS